MSAVIELPARLDLSAADTLLEELRTHEGPIVFNANAVTQIGALCLQILACAARHAKAQDVGFDMQNLPAPVAEQMALMGCPMERLMEGEI